MTGLHAISRLRRKHPALALVPAVAFSANLLCSGLCGLDAHGVSWSGRTASSSSSNTIHDPARLATRAGTTSGSCPHHAPRGEKQDSTPRPSPGHDDDACPGCNWAAEPSLNGMLHLAAPSLDADWSLPIALLEPVDPPTLHAAGVPDSRAWPPGNPLFLSFNILRI